MRHKDGHWVWIFARGKLISRDTSGRPEWVAGINLDISQRKLAEMSLRENEHLMRLVTENMGGRLAYFDHERRLQFANKATYALFGGSAATRIGCRFDDLLGAEAMARLEPHVAGVLLGVPQEYELESVRDGHTVHAVVRLLPDLRDGQVYGFVAMALDVTQFKQAQVELRRADLLLRAAMDATGTAFVLFDPDDRIVFCNDKYRDFYAGIADLIQPGASFESMIRAGVTFHTMEVNNWFDCGKKEVLLETNAMMLKRPGAATTNTEGLDNTIIIPPVYIGEHCSISHSIIGPNVSIGSHTRIFASMVRESIVGHYASLEEVVLHHSIIGNDSSIQGPRQSLNTGDNTEIDFG